MAVLMTDKVSIRGPAHFIRNDVGTQMVWFTVNRYHDGVDLSKLGWSIHFRNANGAEDIAAPHENPDVRSDRILIGWLVRGAATAAVGDLTFNLRGAATVNGETLRWSSGDEKRPVYDAQTSGASGSQSQQISELDAFISRVQNELPSILAARDEANEAATAANIAAESAASAAESAGKAAGNANTAANTAITAAAAANDAAKTADKATDAANEAATNANNVAENAVKLPLIGENGNWQLWDVDERKYNDSGKPTQGDDGGYYRPSVSGDGVLSWSASRNDMLQAASANIRGPKGDKGDRGTQGPQGTVGMTGPKGDKGDKGDRGERGATGEQGLQGERGPAGPQGEQGPQGEKGDKGDPGEVTLDQLATKANAVIQTVGGERFIRIHPEAGTVIQIETDTEKIIYSSKNINPGVDMGCAYMSNNGSFNTSQPSYTSTKKFPVIYGLPYVDSTSNNTKDGRKTFHYWDADGNWLGVRRGSENYTINDRIEGAAMMAITYYDPQQNIPTWAQVEVGTIATPYEEFGFYEEHDVVDGKVDIIAVEDGKILVGSGSFISATYNKNLSKALDNKAEALLCEEVGTNSVKVYPESGSMINVLTDGYSVRRCGKNLIPFPYLSTSSTVNGITFTDNGDGSITINGTSTASAASDFNLGDVATGNTSAWYGLTHGTVKEGFVVGLWDGEGNPVRHSGLNMRINGYTAAQGYRMQIRALKGVEINNVTVWPTLEVGTTPTAFELYRDGGTFAVENGEALVPPMQGCTTLRTNGTSIAATYKKPLALAFEEMLSRIAALEAALTNA